MWYIAAFTFNYRLSQICNLISTRKVFGNRSTHITSRTKVCMERSMWYSKYVTINIFITHAFFKPTDFANNLHMNLKSMHSTIIQLMLLWVHLNLDILSMWLSVDTNLIWILDSPIMNHLTYKMCRRSSHSLKYRFVIELCWCRSPRFNKENINNKHWLCLWLQRAEPKNKDGLNPKTKLKYYITQAQVQTT